MITQPWIQQCHGTSHFCTNMRTFPGISPVKALGRASRCEHLIAAAFLHSAWQRLNIAQKFTLTTHDQTRKRYQINFTLLCSWSLHLWDTQLLPQRAKGFAQTPTREAWMDERLVVVQFSVTDSKSSLSTPASWELPMNMINVTPSLDVRVFYCVLQGQDNNRKEKKTHAAFTVYKAVIYPKVELAVIWKYI